MIDKLLRAFLHFIQTEEIELYNEAGFQHELALFIRQKFDNTYKVRLEKNIGSLNLNKRNFIKREIDIYLESKTNPAKRYAIELKLTHGRAVPRRMFQAFEDVLFLEQLKNSGFKNGFLLFATPNKTFWQASLATWPLYKCFQNPTIVFNDLTNNCVPQFLRKELKNGQFKLETPYKTTWIDLKKQDGKMWRCFIAKV